MNSIISYKEYHLVFEDNFDEPGLLRWYVDGSLFHTVKQWFSADEDGTFEIKNRGRKRGALRSICLL